MSAFGEVVLTFVGIVGGVLAAELVAWVRHRRTRRKPSMTIEEATEQLKAELAEHARRTEEAMLRIVFGEDN